MQTGRNSEQLTNLQEIFQQTVDKLIMSSGLWYGKRFERGQGTTVYCGQKEAEEENGLKNS